MAEYNIGPNANLLKGAIDSHDTNTYNTDNSVNTINNVTNNSNVFQAQKTMAQMHAENVQTFTDEVIKLCDTPGMTTVNGMLTADAFHQLNMLKLRLMLSQQEADGIIAQVQQSLAMTRQQKQQEQMAQQRAETAKQMASMAPPMPSMQTPPPMPKFDPQKVQLSQMQGFNPLQAAQQMGIGMGSMPSMPNSMPSMLQNMSQQSPSMPQMPQDMPLMPNKVSGTKDLVVPEQQISDEQERIPQYGIILTDSLALADKYGCDPQDVYDLLNDFIQDSADAEQHWYLLDAGNYRNNIDTQYWGDYNELLFNFIQDNGFQTGLATPVFIIGGSDVIPVPQLEDPQWGGMIPADIAYCFDTTFFSDLWEGDRTINTDYVRNTVSRLPLECGKMANTLQDDLQSYFNLCAMLSDGIDVPGVAMASNVEWTNNSVTMSQHLPLIHQRTDDEREIYKGMYMCPKLVVKGNGSAEEVDEEILDDYKQALDKAGMLLFNLHGSDSHGDSGFYCNGKGGYPESFNIELMKQSNARVFNTVACFGARYDGYERDDSMLMSALMGGGKVLYAGSTVSVPMIGDEEQNYPAGVTQYPGSGSEKFMPLYCYYQFCGLPAGQAMMQAKLDYFNTFRHIERDDFSLSTMMMFGLYGNPMLHVKRRDDVIQAAMQYEVLPQLPATKVANAPVRMARKSCLISKQQLQASKSLLDQVRGLVDQNLSAIHGMVQQNLYNALGLEPRWLEQVDAYQVQNVSGGIDEGYIYYYDADNKQGRKSMIEVDKQGKITHKVTYK